MKQKITFTIEWWNENDDKIKIKANHQRALEETAIEQILRQYNEGETYGDLNDNIHMDDTDPEDGISYSGVWELTTKNHKN